MKHAIVIIYYTTLFQAWWLLNTIAWAGGGVWATSFVFGLLIACFEWSIEANCKPKRLRNGRFA